MQGEKKKCYIILGKAVGVRIGGGNTRKESWKGEAARWSQSARSSAVGQHQKSLTLPPSLKGEERSWLDRVGQEGGRGEGWGCWWVTRDDGVDTERSEWGRSMKDNKGTRVRNVSGKMSVEGHFSLQEILTVSVPQESTFGIPNRQHPQTSAVISTCLCVVSFKHTVYLLSCSLFTQLGNLWDVFTSEGEVVDWYNLACLW